MAGYYSGSGRTARGYATDPHWRGVYDTLGRLVTAWQVIHGDEPFVLRAEGYGQTLYLLGANGVPFRYLQP